MSDDRANRLRERRNKSANPDKADKPDNQNKTAKPEKLDGADNLDNSGRPGNSDSPNRPENEPKPVKQRADWRALQIQLPDDLRDELELLLDETNLELKRDGEDGLEKFMHFYPLLVSAGLERIEDMDVDERRLRAKEFE